MRQQLVVAMTIGGMVGAFCGAVEAGVFLVRISWGPLDTHTIAKAMVLYGLPNAIIVGFWGLVAGRGMDLRTFEIRTLAFSLLTMGYLFGGLYVNRLWLPEITKLPSLVFTGSWTLAWLAGAWALLKLRTRPGHPPRTDLAWIGALRMAAIGLAVVAGLSFVPPLLAGRPTRAGGAAPTVLGPAGRPNVLLIVMDTTRADRLSSYGYPRNTTPHLDRFAQEGVLFEQASATAPWTLPSHASLFTGLYVAQHGADTSHRRLDDHLVTLAELLREQGYQTVGFSNNGAVSVAMNFQQGFEVFEESRFFRGQAFRQLAIVRLLDRFQLPQRGGNAHAAETNKRIRAWFERRYDRRRPFFLFINYMEPHFSYEPPEPYRRRFLRLPNEVRRSLRRGHAVIKSPPPVSLDEPIRETLGDLYDGELAYLDMRIGELLDEFRARKLLDDTVVIVTSDHGENIGHHEILGHHDCVYETLLHVPLIIRYPKALPAGARVGQPVSLVDVLPTLLALLEVRAPALEASLPGYSFVGSGLAVREDRVILSEYEIARLGPQGAGGSGRTNATADATATAKLKSLREGALKFIRSPDGRHELYDLERDPAESRNLIAELPGQAAAMEAKLVRHFKALKPVGSPEPVPELDAVTREQLRALGYLH
ncbi:MAG: sulfatase [Candidatus Omnitrophica bacterium]|nr:sulfatase [Candidatus Omnitrophota bacterium]